MRFFKSAISVVLACGLAAAPCALAAAKRHHSHSAARAHHKSHHKASHKSASRHSSHTRSAKLNPNKRIPPIPMKHGRLYVPPPMRGSHAILVRQNRRNDAEDLSRIQNKSQLISMKDAGYLVSLPASRALVMDDDLPKSRQYARPWTVKFLENLAHAHYVRFHRPLKVTSAVRTAAFQRRLMRVNANAAPPKGNIASPHLSGAAVDISKKGLKLSEIAWMRAYLLPLQEAGKIDVEEEFYQACFHINVYKSYLPKHHKRHRSPATLLATGVR